MDDFNLAYTAGIVDGEGCISLHSRSRLKKNVGGVYLGVSVCNTNEKLIQWLGGCYGGHTSSRTLPITENRKPLYEWSLNADNALKFIKLIYPYLRLKTPQAELAIKFQEAKKARVKTRPLTPEVRVLEEADRVLMASFNRKGIV